MITRWLGRLLRASFVTVAAFVGFLLAAHNRWGAPAMDGCLDTFGTGTPSGACVAPGAPGWVLVLAAIAGAAISLGILQLGRNLRTDRHGALADSQQ